MMDVIRASTNDLGPLSLDSFRRMNLSASWKFVGRESPSVDKATSEEVSMQSGVFFKLLMSLIFCLHISLQNMLIQFLLCFWRFTS